MNNPLVPISWGELIDKITILEIKLNKLSSKEALDNVNKEFQILNELLKKDSLAQGISKDLIRDLRKVNEKLWEIEDNIREKERLKEFDDEFIQLARSVYFTNDERSVIKKNINKLTGSLLIEEKSYAKYS